MADETLWVIAEETVRTMQTPVPIEGMRDGRSDTGGGYGRLTEQLNNVMRKRVPIDAMALKAQMGGLLKVVGELFDNAEQQTGMKLTEVELSVEINGEGQVSLVGTGGKVSNSGGITLKFTRP